MKCSRKLTVSLHGEVAGPGPSRRSDPLQDLGLGVCTPNTARVLKVGDQMIGRLSVRFRVPDGAGAESSLRQRLL